MARTRCDWCKKRRQTMSVRMAMRRKQPGDPYGSFGAYAVRQWAMCKKCITGCEWELSFRFNSKAPE